MFPRLYPIADAGLLRARAVDLASFAAELKTAGVTLLQYRNKSGSPRAMLDDAAVLRRIFPAGSSARLIMNDRADLALLSGLDGVHVGQDDLSVQDARSIVGPSAWIGISTHNLAQLEQADATGCDYIAFGPIFATASKENPDPVVGLEGLRLARARTKKPLVAIGGITRENCRATIDAGADSVAVISALLPLGSQGTREIAENFLSALAST